MFVFEAISFLKLRSGYGFMPNKSLKLSRYFQVNMIFFPFRNFKACLPGRPGRLTSWTQLYLYLIPVNKLISVVLVLLFFLQLKGLGVRGVNLSQNSKLLSMQDIAIRDRIVQSDLFLNNHLSQNSTGKYRPGLKAFEKNTNTIHIIFALKGCARAGTTPDNTVYEQYKLSWSLW